MLILIPSQSLSKLKRKVILTQTRIWVTSHWILDWASNKRSWSADWAASFWLNLHRLHQWHLQPGLFLPTVPSLIAARSLSPDFTQRRSHSVSAPQPTVLPSWHVGLVCKHYLGLQIPFVILEWVRPRRDFIGDEGLGLPVFSPP